jgi:DNA primase
MITDETLERVREAADIVEIIGEQVKLKRAGASYRGACPFHGGKNPNFAVSTRHNSYYCFKCGVKGDVFTFVRERMGLDFVEAVKYVGARSGVEVQETASRRDAQVADPREPLWEANAAAAEFFQRRLWDDDEGAAARDYLASRRVSREVAETAGLGYAPRDGGLLRAHLHSLGHDDARLIDAGLLVQREGRDEPSSRFWGRLIFPILDAAGRHVGFGGRVLGAGEPKYLNSAESTVYSKGKLLYGLNWAKHPIRKADRVLVVEGYLDAIRLAGAGIEEAVAPLGTALTEQQAATLVKYTKNVFLLYDSDEAGLKATFRTGLELLRLGVSARVVTLPDGEDPDSYVDKHGPEKLEHHLATAIDIFDRQVQLLERKGWFAELHRKRRAIDKLLPTIRATADPLMRDIYIKRAADAAGVDRELLVREAAAEPARHRGAPGDRAPSRTQSGPPAAPPPEQQGSPRGGDPYASVVYEPLPKRNDWQERGAWKGREWKGRKGSGRRAEEWVSSDDRPRVQHGRDALGAERDLTRAMLHERGHVETVAERYGPESFRHPLYRSIFGALLEHPDASLEELAAALPDDAAAALDQLVSDPLENEHSVVDASLVRLQVRMLDDALNEIDRRLIDTASPPSDSETDALVREKMRLMAERKVLVPIGRRFGKAGY